ncbi:MAG: adenylate/guanylate cyclase domain-containing protein [Archangium sp.]|nr:adenylate/guanylate cyclase domain-containing protein [Archangium sp.]
MRTANLAIVFTDIKGFTERTSKQTLEENEKLLKTHNDLLAPLFRALGGRVVKTIGDAFMVTFESPTSAVLSGVAIQDALWKYNQTASAEAQLRVRVAINVGEVRLEGNDVFGEPVNIAARVEGLAEADDVTFTEAVYLSMNRAEVSAEELGKFELKGIPEPVKLFRVARATKEATEAPYGNKGLTRAQESAANSGSQKALELATQVASTALESTMGVANKLVEGARSSSLPSGLSRKHLALGAGALLTMLLISFFALGRSDIEKAIDAAANAKGDERRAKIEAARKLINDEGDVMQRTLDTGLLSEKLGEASAVGHYVRAAKNGSKDAESRIIALLKHSNCRMRATAADAIADLQLTRARGKLEDLAENGGPDDGEQVLVFGCNSKSAASVALKRLKD